VRSFLLNFVPRTRDDTQFVVESPLKLKYAHFLETVAIGGILKEIAREQRTLSLFFTEVHDLSRSHTKVTEVHDVNRSHTKLTPVFAYDCNYALFSICGMLVRGSVFIKLDRSPPVVRGGFGRKKRFKNCIRHRTNEKDTHNMSVLKLTFLVDLEQKVCEFFQ
jgi:hypothetical protein